MLISTHEQKGFKTEVCVCQVKEDNTGRLILGVKNKFKSNWRTIKFFAPLEFGAIEQSVDDSQKIK